MRCGKEFRLISWIIGVLHPASIVGFFILEITTRDSATSLPLERKTAPRVAKKMDIFFRIMGVPSLLYNDNGSEFEGTCLLLMKKAGIKVVTENPRSPNVKGGVERGNHDVKKKIFKYVNEPRNPL